MLIQAALIAFYPLVLHVGVIGSNHETMLLAMVFLSLGIFYKGLVRPDTLSWLIVFVFNSLLFMLHYFDLVRVIVLLPPLVVPVLLFFVFFRSLLPGSTPLVTAIGDWARGPLSIEMKKYTRHVTELWAAVFVFLFIETLILTIWSSMEVWSWFTNLGNHFLVGTIFFGEFMVRKAKFPDHDHPSFKDYLKIVISSREMYTKRDLKQ